MFLSIFRQKNIIKLVAIGDCRNFVGWVSAPTLVSVYALVEQSDRVRVLHVPFLETLILAYQ